jgi:hypothetical protein
MSSTVNVSNYSFGLFANDKKGYNLMSMIGGEQNFTIGDRLKMTVIWLKNIFNEATRSELYALTHYNNVVKINCLVSEYLNRMLVNDAPEKTKAELENTIELMKPTAFYEEMPHRISDTVWKNDVNQILDKRVKIMFDNLKDFIKN